MSVTVKITRLSLRSTCTVAYLSRCSADASRAWIGTSNVTGGGEEPIRLGEIPVPGSPLYAAGLTRGDTITALDGTPIGTPADFRTALAALKPGQPAAITFATRAGSGSATITPVPDPRLTIVTLEKAGGTLTPQQDAFRRAWLGD